VSGHRRRRDKARNYDWRPPAREARRRFRYDRFPHRPLRQEEPIAAPGDIAGDEPQTLDLDANRLQMPIALDILDGRFISAGQFDRDDSDRRLEAMGAKADTAEVGKRHRRADRGVAAHAKIADIVEEYQAGGAARVFRFAQQRAHKRVIAARLVDGKTPDMVERLGEKLAPLGKRAVAERRPALDDEPRGLALCMGVDDAHDFSFPRAANRRTRI